MKVFLTSATGYIGSEIARQLIAEGHTVVGLARSEESAAKLKAMGAEAAQGSLEQPEIIVKAAASADAVIHTAFVHSGASMEEACRIDLVAVKAMLGALAGSEKPFIVTSGTAVMGNTGPPANEEFPPDPDWMFRVISERAALMAVDDGVKTIVLRMPPFVWGNGGAGLIMVQLATARELGKAYYLLPGTQMTSGVHVEDAARAYVLALKHAPAGSIYNITTANDITNRSMAEAVGANLGVPVEGISSEEALQKQMLPALITAVFALNNRASAAKAQRQLHWQGTNVDMLKDIASGSYKGTIVSKTYNLD